MFNSNTCTLVSEEATLAKRGYTLIKKINSGTFANVYLAEYTPNEHSDERITLACKVVNSAKLIKKKVLSRKFINRELIILAKLNHPYLINVHKILQWFNKYYIFMPYAENGDLFEYIRSLKENIPEKQCRIWFRQLSLGVQYIHEMNIAHRDIKCENILLTSEMNIKLADFGFARYVIDECGKQMLSDTYCGSVNYIAPEVVNGSPYYPKISDMWSMGVILFTMINKTMPFRVDDNKRLYQQQMQRRYKFIAKEVSVISEHVTSLVANLLEPNVSQRWTIEQVLNCEWFTSDTEMMNLSFEEQEALKNAKIEREKQQEKHFTKPKPQVTHNVTDINKMPNIQEQAYNECIMIEEISNSDILYEVSSVNCI